MNKCEYPAQEVRPKLRDLSELGLLKEIADNTEGGGGRTGSGILVAVVNENSTIPTTRPDGTPLENEDYVKPDPDSHFPFTINGLEFPNKFSKAIYFNGEWVMDAGLIQDTSETPLENPTRESFEDLRNNQQQVNIDFVYQLKNSIIEYTDLNNVPSSKLYKRIYRQTSDTVDRTAGLYWRNFETNTWEKVGSGDIQAGNTLPSGKYDGELFILLEDVAGNPKTKKGLYRYNGNLWVHIAHTEPYTDEIEVKNSETESISKTATTQKEINEENATIIGQEKEIEVDEETDLIGSVNWLNENKLGQMKLSLDDDNNVINEDGDILSLSDIIDLFNSKKYWMYLENQNIVFLPTTPTSTNEFKFLGDFSLPEEIVEGEEIRVESFAEILIKNDNKAYYTQQENETTVFKVNDIVSWLESKDDYTYPEKFYPTVQALVDYVELKTSKLIVVPNSIEYDGQMIPQLTKGDIKDIANYIDKGVNVIIKDKYNALYGVIRGDKINEEEYQVEYQYFDGKSVVWTYMADGDVVEYKVVEPLLVDGEYNTLLTENKTVIGAINELKAIKSYIFKGYVASNEPTGTINNGELWHLGNVMPDTFPIKCRVYNNGSWSTEFVDYSPTSLDLWANIDDDHGYYWFGNNWNLIDVNVEYDDETIDKNLTGQLEIKDKGIKFPKFNDEVIETNVTEEDDEQIVTEGAVWREKVKEIAFELDESEENTDKLILKVTNNKDEDIVDEEIEIDKIVLNVTTLPTEDIKRRLYNLTEDTEDYDSGVYLYYVDKWLRLDNTESWTIKDSVFEIQKGEPTEEEEFKRVDKLVLQVIDDKDEKVIDKEVDVNVEEITIWDYDSKTETTNTYDYEIHMKEKEKIVDDFITFSSPEPFRIRFGTTDNPYIMLEYSDDKQDWSPFGSSYIDAAESGSEYSVYIRGTVSSTDFSSNFRYFQIEGSNVEVKGNIKSLLNYQDVSTVIYTTNCFSYLFYRCTAITKADKLILCNADDYISEKCFYYMFSDCTNLIQPPELPAKNLGNHCYSYMFAYCTSLTRTPNLPATTLATGCYSYMFRKCTSLIQISELPATVLEPSCYDNMFMQCDLLSQLPNLPATILATSCYQNMFNLTSIRLYTTPVIGYEKEWSLPEISDSLPNNWNYNFVESSVTRPMPGIIYYTNDPIQTYSTTRRGGAKYIN